MSPHLGRLNMSRNSNNEPVQVACKIIRTTEKAILINDGIKDIWLPSRYVKLINDDEIELPEWLAKDKGII